MMEDRRFLYDWKTMLVEKYGIPRFVDISEGSPPFPLLVDSLLPSTLNISVVVAALVMTMLVYQVAHSGAHKSLGITIILSFMFSYPFLYVVTQDPYTSTCLFFLTVSNYCLLKFYEYQLTHYLFLFGIFFGMTFLCDYQSVVLVPMYALVYTYVFFDIKNWKYFFSLLLISFFPFIASLIGVMYIHWIFSEDALLLLKFVKKSLINVQLSDSQANSFLPIVLFSIVYTLSILFVGKIKGRIKKAFQLYMLVPIYFIVIVVFFDWKPIGIYLVVYLLAFFIPIIPYIKWEKIKIISIALFIILFVISWNESYADIEKTIHAANKNEEFFSKMNTVVGQNSGKILIDDRIFYQFLWSSKDVDRYLLPYDSTFELAVRRPEQFVEYVVLCNECIEDRIFSTHRQQVINNRLRHFSLVWSNDQYAVFEISR